MPRTALPSARTAGPVEVRYSYIDWAIPETDVLVRMGLQPFVMPGFVAGSAVLDGDGAGHHHRRQLHRKRRREPLLAAR